MAKDENTQVKLTFDRKLSAEEIDALKQKTDALEVSTLGHHHHHDSDELPM